MIVNPISHELQTVLLQVWQKGSNTLHETISEQNKLELLRGDNSFLNLK